MTSSSNSSALASCVRESVYICPRYLRGLILLSTAQSSGFTLKPCSMRPTVYGKEPPENNEKMLNYTKTKT